MKIQNFSLVNLFDYCTAKVNQVDYEVKEVDYICTKFSRRLFQFLLFS